MNLASDNAGLASGGILIRGAAADDIAATRQTVLSLLDTLDLDPHVVPSAGIDDAGRFVRFGLRQAQITAWAPGHDTLDLWQTLKLETFWTSRAIMSGEFHEVFLREQGSMSELLPPRYFVPGDRTWFCNPDEASSDASGFEGSWVMYLGAGRFSNFWKRDQPFTLMTKCLEIYHWRHAVYLDAQGEARIDEAKVAALVEATLKDPAGVGKILELMQRYREPKGVYVKGGCIDTTREFSR